MKKLSPKTLALLIAAAAVVAIGAFLLLKPSSEPTEEPGSSESEPSSSLSSEQEGSSSQVSEIPDIDSTNQDYEQPYPEVDFSNLSPTTLTKEEVDRNIEEMLPKLLALDEQTIEQQVSPRTFGGEYNPFRLMLDACLADEAIGDAFRNMGSATTYEILEIRGDPSQSNFVTVTLAVTTPYMASRAPELAAGEDSAYDQEMTSFKATGAAAAISAMDMGSVPASTDLVKLEFLIEDDVPMLYYPTSYTYGDEIPQYAFFWGAVEFQGTRGGDLLLKNDYGNAREMSEAAFGNEDLVEYLNTAVDGIQKSDMDALATLSFGGDDLDSHFAISSTYPSYQRKFDDYSGMEEAMKERMASLECSLRYFILTSTETGSQSAAIEMTASVVDPFTGARVYKTLFRRFSDVDNLSSYNGVGLNNSVSDLIEFAMGGDSITAEDRMLLEERLGK